jgi:hypothetical protein
MLHSVTASATPTRSIGPPEFQLACAIFRGRIETIQSLCSAADFDWPAFLRYVDAQTIAASIFHVAQSHSVLRLFPEHVVESLRISFLTQYRWNSLLLARIAELNAAIRGRGYDAIVLKGLHPAQEYYGQFAARQVGDIDLLIADRHDLADFEEILAGLGYRRRSRILGTRALMTRYTHHMEFDGPLAPLDLHWVLRRHSSFRLNYSDLWQRKREVQVRNVPMLALSLEYELVLAVLSIHNDLQIGMLRLKSILDLYAMLKWVAPTLSWEAFFARRAEERLLRMSVNVFDFALEVLDCRDDLVALADSIVQHRRLLVLRDADSKLALFRGNISQLQRRLWALRLYEISTLRAFWWWGISLPFRLAEHRE